VGTDRPEHRHPDERHARDAAGDDRVAQDVERQDRLGRAALDHRKERRENRRAVISVVFVNEQALRRSLDEVEAVDAAAGAPATAGVDSGR
jgi:hypothetical protein